MLPFSPVQGKHFPISKVDIILLLMLQLVNGDCGEGRKLLPKDHLEPKVRGPGEQGSGQPLEGAIRMRRKEGHSGTSWGRPEAGPSRQHPLPLWDSGGPSSYQQLRNLGLLGQRCNAQSRHQGAAGSPLTHSQTYTCTDRGCPRNSDPQGQ